jgi:hypothetical protein
MSFADKAREKAEQARKLATEKAQELAAKSKDFAAEHKDQIAGGIDKAGQFADQRTGNRHHDAIAKAGQKAADLLDKAVPAADPTEPEPTEEPPATEVPKPDGTAPWSQRS